MISFIRNYKAIDVLTYIPLKPKDIKRKKYDRFRNLKLVNSSQNGIKLQQVLGFNKDFSQKGNDLYVRKEIVKGAFNVLSDIKGKNIIIIDDVYSTGSTIEEPLKLFMRMELIRYLRFYWQLIK